MLLFIIVLIATCGFTFLALRTDGDYGAITSIFLWIVTIGMIIFIIAENGCPQGNLVGFQQRYNVLQYQVDNDFYTNIVDNSKKELYDEVMSYNRIIARGRELDKNIWVGVFYSGIYNELEFVELK